MLLREAEVEVDEGSGVGPSKACSAGVEKSGMVLCGVDEVSPLMDRR